MGGSISSTGQVQESTLFDENVAEHTQDSYKHIAAYQSTDDWCKMVRFEIKHDSGKCYYKPLAAGYFPSPHDASSLCVPGTILSRWEEDKNYQSLATSRYAEGYGLETITFAKYKNFTFCEGGNVCPTLVSPNGYIEARVQTDGNFVVYEGETPLWASNTYGQGTGPYALRMQTNGNLVLYDSNEIAMWSTDTQGLGSGPYTLVMQDDRNLVIYCNYDVLGQYAPIWSSYYGIFSPINC
jgi:hypothetical protein